VNPPRNSFLKVCYCVLKWRWKKVSQISLSLQQMFATKYRDKTRFIEPLMNRQTCWCLRFIHWSDNSSITKACIFTQCFQLYFIPKVLCLKFVALFIPIYYGPYSIIENSSVLVFKLFLESLLLWLWLWMKYNIASQPYYNWWTHACCIKTIVIHASVILIFVWKEDT